MSEARCVWRYAASARRGSHLCERTAIEHEDDMHLFVSGESLAANASASPALASEGLAGLSQALPTRDEIATALFMWVAQGGDKCDERAYTLQAADAVLALLRESRESRPPVATSDEECVCPCHVGASSRGKYRYPQSRGCTSCAAKHAAPAESVEEPRCAYVYPVRYGGFTCGWSERLHKTNPNLYDHPFTAVPPVAREEKPGVCPGCGELCDLCETRAKRPGRALGVCDHGLCDKCPNPPDAPAASPRRAAIEKMRAEQQHAEAAWFLFKTGAPEYKDVNLAAFVQHALGFGAATLAAMEGER